MTVATAPRSAVGPMLAAASGLAAAMGIGRFVYTPLLPIMVDAHRMSAGDGALIATANYAGYLLGAVLLSRRPELNSRRSFQVSAGLLVASEALMAVPAPTVFPALLRLIAGVASAVIFVGAAEVAARYGRQAAGIAFGGVGFGIALTGLLVLAARSLMSWQSMWLWSAALTALLLIPALRLDIRPAHRVGGGAVRATRVWRTLLIAYFLQGLGYIVIGTFLVAAVSEQRGPVIGTAMWVVVGAAAAPSTLLWGAAGRRWAPSVALVIALLAQCLSALLPAFSITVAPLVLAAAIFGATFMGIVLLTMRVGSELSDGAAAPLTAAYAVGQMFGPVLVAPVIGDGYRLAFVIATAVLIAATGAAISVARQLRRT